MHERTHKARTPQRWVATGAWLNGVEYGTGIAVVRKNQVLSEETHQISLPVHGYLPYGVVFPPLLSHQALLTRSIIPPLRTSISPLSLHPLPDANPPAHFVCPAISRPLETPQDLGSDPLSSVVRCGAVPFGLCISVSPVQLGGVQSSFGFGVGSIQFSPVQSRPTPVQSSATP